MRVFDPRDGQWKESDNPALMIGQFVRETLPWRGDVDEAAIVAAADSCDGMTAEQRAVFMLGALLPNDVASTPNGDGTFTHKVRLV